jgi:Nuclear transport factor 2 (NTF2) domain
MMTFEGTSFQGPQAIVDKLKGIGNVSHVVKSKDLQPSTTESALLIFVTGSIRIGGDNPLHFSQFFQLVSTGPGQYYVHNTIFRLNYGL